MEDPEGAGISPMMMMMMLLLLLLLLWNAGLSI